MAFKKLSLNEVAALANEAAESGPDYTVASAGGDYKPPEAGATVARLVGYIETGVHTRKSAQFGDKTKPMATFIFELSGRKHEPKELDGGRKVPHLIQFELAISQSPKSGFYKLFKLLTESYPGAKNPGQLLGKAWRATVYHRKYKVGDAERVAAELSSKERGWSFQGLEFEDPETGEMRKVKVGEVLSDYRLFFWDTATLDQWDSLFIDGTYDNGDSKNKFQEKIKVAENLAGSEIERLLIEEGREGELVPAPKAAKTGEAPAAEAESGDDDAGDPPFEADPPKEAPAKARKQAQETPKSEVEGEVASTPKNASKARESAPAKPATKPATKAKAQPKVEPEGDDDSDPLQGL